MMFKDTDGKSESFPQDLASSYGP